jgi:hypothetical protein
MNVNPTYFLLAVWEYSKNGVTFIWFVISFYFVHLIYYVFFFDFFNNFTGLVSGNGAWWIVKCLIVLFSIPKKQLGNNNVHWKYWRKFVSYLSEKNLLLLGKQLVEKTVALAIEFRVNLMIYFGNKSKS